MVTCYMPISFMFKHFESCPNDTMITFNNSVSVRYRFKDQFSKQGSIATFSTPILGQTIAEYCGVVTMKDFRREYFPYFAGIRDIAGGRPALRKNCVKRGDCLRSFTLRER